MGTLPLGTSSHMVRKPWLTAGHVNGDPPWWPQAPPHSEYNYEGNPEREPPRIMKENNACCTFRPVRFGMTPDDIRKGPSDTPLLVGLCPTLWATTVSVLFPLNHRGLAGPGRTAVLAQGRQQGTFPFLAQHPETRLSGEGGGITCMLGTTRCLESSVLLLMRLLQSSRSKVLWEKVGQQSGRSSSSTWPGSFIHRG